MTDEAYNLVFVESFVNDFRKLSRENQLRVRKRIEILKADPYQGRKLENTEIGQYRLRIGSLRVPYDIEEANVIVLRVLKREDAYRKF